MWIIEIWEISKSTDFLFKITVKIDLQSLERYDHLIFLRGPQN